MFGIDDMAAASLISTGANVLGGIFGKKGPSLKSLNKQAEVQYNWQRKLNQTALQDRVSDATKAGIHPLYAIGGNVNPGGISMPSGDGQSDYDRFSGMGQSIERAVTAFATREERDVMKKSTMLDLERKQLENEVLRNQATGSRMALQEQAGNAPPAPSVSGEKDKYAKMGTPVGYANGVVNLHQLAIDEDGDVVRYYNNNELGDNEFAQAGHFVRYTLPDYIHAGINKFKRSLKSFKSSHNRPVDKSFYLKGGG